MNERAVVRVHWSFWIISAVALIWNFLGVINFFVQMNPDAVTGFRESERAIIEGRPGWATGAFAIAVFGGTLGSLLLLLRRPVAYHIFIVSLVGVIVTLIHALMAGSNIGFGALEILGIILMPLAVAVFLIWYAKQAMNRRWIQ